MVRKKNEKIPYKEYQALKEKGAKNGFKLQFYPWPIMTVFLVPVAIFIMGMIFYFVNIRNFGQ